MASRLLCEGPHRTKLWTSSYGEKWGAWSGVTPDGSGLLVRDAGTQEIYALDMEFP